MPTNTEAATQRPKSKKPPFLVIEFNNEACTPLFIAQFTAIWAIGVLALAVLYAAFTLLGYALLSIATIPPDHSLSVFTAALIGSGILLAPISFLTLPLSVNKIDDLHHITYCFYVLSQHGMQHVSSLFVVPVILGGSALGWKILQVSGAALGDMNVDRGHLVAASALGGYVFRMILELLKACFLERSSE